MDYAEQEPESSSTKQIESVSNPLAAHVCADELPTTEELSQHLDAVRRHADGRPEASESSNYRLGAGRYLAP